MSGVSAVVYAPREESLRGDATAKLVNAMETMLGDIFSGIAPARLKSKWLHCVKSQTPIDITTILFQHLDFSYHREPGASSPGRGTDIEREPARYPSGTHLLHPKRHQEHLGVSQHITINHSIRRPLVQGC